MEGFNGPPVGAAYTAEVVRRYEDLGHSRTRIAEALGTDTRRIRRILENAGVEVVPRPEQQMRHAVRLYEQELGRREIADRMELGDVTVIGLLRRAGIEPRFVRRYSRIDPETAGTARRLYREGMSLAAIGRRLNLGKGRVGRVVHERRALRVTGRQIALVVREGASAAGTAGDTARDTLSVRVAGLLRDNRLDEIDPDDLEKIAPLPVGNGGWMAGVVAVCRDDGTPSIRVDYRHRDRAVRVCRLDAANGVVVVAFERRYPR